MELGGSTILTLQMKTVRDGDATDATAINIISSAELQV